MARKQRIHFSGAVYHTILRGNNKQNIFLSEKDKFKLSFFLQEASEKYPCKIHAFCFMANHIHLAVQVGDIPLSKFIQNVSLRYTKWINKNHNRVGHLFQGRYKAILINSDAYLKELVRYIHLNPVRAKIVSCPSQYYWSSHCDYLGLTRTLWLTTTQVLSQFSQKKSIAIQSYIKFIAAGIAGSYQPKFYTGVIDTRILGEEEFVNNIHKQHFKITQTAPKIESIIEYIADYYQITKAELTSLSRARHYSEPRALIVWLAAEVGTATLTNAATLFKKDVTQFIRKIRNLKNNKPQHLEKIKEEFNKSISQA